MTGIGGWAGYLENADRLSLDHHPYFVRPSAALSRLPPGTLR